MAKLFGKKLLEFTLFGNKYQVREVPKGHAKLSDDTEEAENIKGMCYLEDRIIYLQARGFLTLEQQQTVLLHEIQHIIEDHYDIDHEGACDTEQGSEIVTDQISLGWLYVIRGCPEVISFVNKKTDEEQKRKTKKCLRS